jgi:hypothetical protein
MLHKTSDGTDFDLTQITGLDLIIGSTRDQARGAVLLAVHCQTPASSPRAPERVRARSTSRSG